MVIRRSLSPLIREAVLADTRSRSEGSRSAVKSQRAYAMHVLECIGRITADSASGRDAVFGSHTLQDDIVHNLQVLFQDHPPADSGFFEVYLPSSVMFRELALLSLLAGDPALMQDGLGPPPQPASQTKVNPKDGLTYVWIKPGTLMMGCVP